MRRRIAPEVNSTSTTTSTVTVTPRKVWPWLWPWAVPATLLPLSGPMWLAWGREQDFWPLATLLIGPAVLAWYTSRVARARGDSVRFHAAATVAACGLWLFLATLLGPAEVVTLWICLVFACGITWNIRRAVRGQGGDHSDGWSQVGEAVGLARSRVKSARVDGTKVHAVVEVDRGAQTGSAVGSVASRVASYFGLPAGGTRSVVDPDDSGIAHLTLVTQDLLKTPTRWAGPSGRGLSIADAPCVLGVRESGHPLQVLLAADEKRGHSLQHVLITGMVGSGKSAAARLLICEVAVRHDTQVWLSDPVKGRQFLGPIGHLAYRVASTMDESMAMLAELQRLVSARGEHLGERGLDNWVPGCGVPFILAHFEEIAVRIGTAREFVHLVQTARSVGIAVGAGLQKVTYKNISTDARSNFSTILQGGCRDGDQGLALPGHIVEAGASPQLWTNTRPGYMYGVTPGCEDNEWAAPARTFDARVDDYRNHMAEIVDLGGGDVGEEAVFVEPAELIPSGKASPDEAKRLFLERVDELRAAGREVRPADFDAVLRAAGRSRTWLDGALGKLVDAGAIARVRHGVYRFVESRRR